MDRMGTTGVQTLTDTPSHPNKTNRALNKTRYVDDSANLSRQILYQLRR